MRFGFVEPAQQNGVRAVRAFFGVQPRIARRQRIGRSVFCYDIVRAGTSGEEQQSRDLDGNWKFRSAGDDLIKMDDMINFYDNSYQDDNDDTLYATADVALQGGDNAVMWLWRGNHIIDVYVCRFDSKTYVDVVKAKLSEWGVAEENFAYDYQGIGQILEGHFPNAVKFINQAAPIAEDRKQEDGIKAGKG